MKHIFIINPAAGKNDGSQKIYDMAEKLRHDHSLDVDCILTQSPGYATVVTRRIAEVGEDVRFYACGAMAPSTKWPPASSALKTRP